MSKNKLTHLPIPESFHLPDCKFCGCLDPLGPLPEPLSYKEMRVIANRLNLSQKEITNNTLLPKSSVAWVMTGRMKSGGIFMKVQEYLLTMLRQSKQSTPSAQCKSPENLIAKK